jgi:triacylglycerol lipase
MTYAPKTPVTSASPAVDELRCDTRWPLLLVHGVGFRDDWPYRYWGRIPEALTKRGADVHYGLQDAWGGFESNARALRLALHDVVGRTGSEKVNIIAHSKGGLDARVLASIKDCAPHIASITTIASPHAGSHTMDRIMRIPTPLFKITAVPFNGLLRLLGDRNPDFYTVCSQLTSASMQRFNNEYPIQSDIFCQSYAGIMESPLNDATMAIPYSIVSRFDGPNDGLVAVASTPYGEFGGVIAGAASRGISHRDVVDRTRKPLKKQPPLKGARLSARRRRFANALEQEGDRFNIVEWYLRLVADLKTRGF